jgi:TonB family protein
MAPMFRPVVVALLVLAVIGETVLAQPGGARREEGETVEEQPAPQLTRPPRLIQGTPPEYPQEAFEAGLEASVKIRLHIAADGTVSQVDVLEPVGHGFDEAAVEAARQYLFEPAEFDGVAGPIAVETVLHFTLDQVEVAGDDEPDSGPGGGSADPAGPAELPAEAQGPPAHAGDFREPVRIEGEAVERGTRKRLAGIIVSVAELGLDAVTDEEGRFYFHGIPAGSYTLIAVDDRYDRFSRQLELGADESLDVRLWLRRKGGNPYETVVEGEREVLEVTRRKLDRRQLTTVPGTFGDPIRVIQSLPGMARTPFVTGFLIIRGSNPDDSGIYLDGHRIPAVFHFAGGPSVLSPEFLDSIELYPGGYPARFGRAIGGIVSVETRSAKSDGVHGQADIDLLDAGGYVRFPVGDSGALAIAGRRSYLDFMLDFFLPEPDPGQTLIVVPVYYDWQVRYDHDFGKEGSASLFVISSSDRLEVVQADPDENQFVNLETVIQFFRVIGSYRRPVTKNLRLTLSPAFGQDVIRFAGAQFAGDAPTTGVDIVETTLSYRMRLNGNLTDDLALDAGLDIESRVTGYDLVVPISDNLPISGFEAGELDIPSEELGLNIDGYAFGLHADLGWNATSKLRLIPGIRFDNYILQGKYRSSFDPRLAARYTIDDRWTAKGYAGLFHQPTRPEGLERRFGNPDLGLEQAYHTGLGGEYIPAKHWLIDGEAYYIKRDDLAFFTNDTVMNPMTGELEPVNVRNSGVGDTVGVEVLIKRNVTEKLFGWLSYTLSKTRVKPYPDEDYIATIFDQRHVLNAVASYKTGSGWELGGRFRLASGTPTNEIVGSTYEVDDNDYDPIIEDFRGTREPFFHQLDVRVEKTWVFNTWMMGLYLDIQNVYNHDNVEATQYDYRFRDSAPVTGVPFLPTVGIRGQW